MRLTFILPFAFVLLDCKVIHLLHVLKQAVAATMNVQQTKYVILPLVVALLERSVKTYAIQAIVLEGLIVLQAITGKPVLADVL